MDSQFTTLFVNGGIEYPIRNTILEAIPYFAGNTSENIEFTTPFKVGFRHFNIIAKIVAGTVLTPNVDLFSHYDVMIVLKLANFLNIHDDMVSTGFYNWTEHKDWISLSGAKYAYMVYQFNAELVDFRVFFRLHAEPLNALIKTATMILSTRDPVMYINILQFIRSYNFDRCFDEHSEVSRDRILVLNKSRDAMAEMFLIDPYSELMEGYFRYTEEYRDIWSCENISSVPKPELGDETIVPFETAQERFHNFTFGLLDKPLNESDVEFPYNNVVIAGGSISKILNAAYDIKKARQSDVDIFIYANTHDERTRVFSELLDWFKSYNVEFGTTRTYYAVRGSVVTIYIKDIERKFQIISANATTVSDVIGRFDMTHIQWCFQNGKYFGTPGACKALRERVTVLDNIGRLRVDRMVKALYNGYDIQYRVIDDMDITTLIYPIVDKITGIVTHSAQLKKYIREMHGFWYPRTDDNMDAADYREYILCQIEKDSHAAVVTDHPAIVMQNITIGGNFERDYDSISFTTFNPRLIVHGRVQRYGRNTVTSAFGIVHLSTSPMVVSRIIQNDTGIEIVLRATDPEFGAFCAQIEGPICRTYGYNSAHNRIIVNDEISFIMPAYKINRQERTGKSLMRSHNGAPLNIEEDLQPGDEIQVIFIIDCNARFQHTFVTIKPVKIIKTVVHVADAIITLNDTVEELEHVEFDAEIEYGELGI